MFRLVIRSYLLAILALIPAHAKQNPGFHFDSESEQKLAITGNVTSLPLAFTENRGQWNENVKFRADAEEVTLWFTTSGLYYQYIRELPCDEQHGPTIVPTVAADQRSDRFESMMIKASFVGANPNPRTIGEGMLDYYCNYFIGSDSSDWRVGVPNYRAIVLEEVYAGIDLRYYGNGDQMEYDLIVSPGADPSQIHVQYDGAESMELNELGQLVVTTSWGEVIEQKPVVYQDIGGTRRAVGCEFTLIGKSAFGFLLNDDYDLNLALVIDPLLSYSTYLGASGSDDGRDVAVDASGCAYVTGRTYNLDFPIFNALQSSFVYGSCAFLTKFSSDGSSLVYSTFLGPGTWAKAIVVDGTGCAYVAGVVGASDFPTVNPYQTYQGDQDGFVSKLSSDGSELLYSTYVGGANPYSQYVQANDQISDMAVDQSGCAYITGISLCTDYPQVNAYLGPRSGITAFITKLSSNGSSLAYSTYFYGAGESWGEGVAVDASGSAYLTGSTGYTVPAVNPYQSSNQGLHDCFVTKFSPAGTSLVYSTNLGGSHHDYGRSIAVDASGFAYVAGYTVSTDFPTASYYQLTQGSGDGFVAKFGPSGNTLEYSTYLGGTDGSDECEDICVDANGYALVTGNTYSTDFPVWDQYQSDQPGSDVFVTILDGEGSNLRYSSYFGSAEGDFARGIALDPSGNAYIVGGTNASGFPTANPYQTYAGTADVFAMKIDFDGDGDGIQDFDDNCPSAHNTSQTDADEDGFGDACDVCPGSDDLIDSDSDGVPNGCDVCPGSDDGQDSDTDGVPDGCDTCPGHDDLADADGDTVPDGCDTCPDYDDLADADGDTVPDGCDTCPGHDDLADADGDTLPDGCDTCPGHDDLADADGDTVPDGCDNCLGHDDLADADGDTVPDGCDLCLGYDDLADPDADGVPTGCDNCPQAGNPAQEDADNDGTGDACCCVSRVGDANTSGGDEPTIGDVSLMVDALFISDDCVGMLGCLTEADVNQSGGIHPICDDITIGDVSTLIDYLFITGPATATLPDCL